MLKTLQKTLAEDIKNNTSIGQYQHQGNFTSSQLVAIYRNNYQSQLVNTLSKTYSCIKRLVGEEFFKYLAQEYIMTHPITEGTLTHYGDSFSDFIAHFLPCKSMPYLPSVAKFERQYESCYHHHFDFIVSYYPYPVIDIWLLDDKSETLNYEKGGQYIVITRLNDEVEVRELSTQAYQQLTQAMTGA